MTPDAFETFCLSLKGATVVVQWGGTHVYKVGGKMFSTANTFEAGDGPGFAFKASDMAYELLVEHGIARPAKYLARAKWVQLLSRDALPDADLQAYLVQAHGLIAARLTRAVRRDLGLM